MTEDSVETRNVVLLLKISNMSFAILPSVRSIFTRCCFWGYVAALVVSHMNGLQPFERTVEQTIDTITPSSKTITAASMTTNRITNLRELLHYRFFELVHV